MSLKKIKLLINRNKGLLEKKYSVKKLGVFGSYACNKYRKGSDVDILVEFSKTPDFFEFIRLENFLKRILGIKVDLVTRGALKPLIKKTILKEVIYV